ncbi:MAG TPA: beta-ketoacyl synthase N-terminal-like domain-containing protein, partial [Streptosporangiaceae bacterium]
MSEVLSSSAGTPAGREPVIVGGARTPIGRLLGSLAGFSGADLGGIAIRAALERSGVPADQVDYVIMGQVLQAGAGQIPARQAAVAAGLPMSVPALTVNKVCLSGLDAINLAGQLIRLGEVDVVVAGGMESMTQAPHLLPKSRSGYKFGPVEVVDSMAVDGLTDAYDHVSMGQSTERLGAGLGISRAEQDEFAARSQQRAARATKDGLLGEEIVPVEVRSRKETVTFATDEGIRADTTAESLGKLKA